MKDNCIVLSSYRRNTGMSKSISTCNYECMEYGNNICVISNNIRGINGEDIVNDNIQLCKMKGDYILILGLKTDILSSNDNTVIVQSTFHQKDNYMPSVYVLLVHALLDRNNPTNICWENEHL